MTAARATLTSPQVQTVRKCPSLRLGFARSAPAVQCLDWKPLLPTVSRLHRTTAILRSRTVCVLQMATIIQSGLRAQRLARMHQGPIGSKKPHHVSDFLSILPLPRKARHPRLRLLSARPMPDPLASRTTLSTALAPRTPRSGPAWRIPASESASTKTSRLRDLGSVVTTAFAF